MSDEPEDFRKLVLDAQRQFQLLADEARLTLAEICAFGASEQSRITAAKEILDRAYGKSVSPIEISGRDGGPVETKDVSDSAVAFTQRMSRLSAAMRETSSDDGDNDKS